MTKQQAAENFVQYKEGKIKELDRDAINFAIVALTLQSKYEIPEDAKEAYDAGYKAGVEAYRTLCDDDFDRIQFAIKKFESWLNCTEYSWGERNMLNAVISELKGVANIEKL